jgi:hypothetical protein
LKEKKGRLTFNVVTFFIFLFIGLVFMQSQLEAAAGDSLGNYWFMDRKIGGGSVCNFAHNRFFLFCSGHLGGGQRYTQIGKRGIDPWRESRTRREKGTVAFFLQIQIPSFFGDGRMKQARFCPGPSVPGFYITLPFTPSVVDLLSLTCCWLLRGGDPCHAGDERKFIPT